MLSGAAAGCGGIGRRPQVSVCDVPVHAAGELRPQPPGRDLLERVHQSGDGHFRLVPDQQVHVTVSPMLTTAASPWDCRRPRVGSDAVQVRYRYRIYPSLGQQQALARAFGCARVVYNDCLRLRDACHAAGEKISDTAVQRQVITLAKTTPERAWLAEVASVAL